MANKVEFGISQLHVCTYTDDGEGNITLGTPYHQKGAKSFSPEQDAENNVDYADNIDYWSEYTEGQFLATSVLRFSTTVSRLSSSATSVSRMADWRT